MHFYLVSASIRYVREINHVLNNILQMCDSDPGLTPQLNHSDTGTWYAEAHIPPAYKLNRQLLIPHPAPFGGGPRGWECNINGWRCSRVCVFVFVRVHLHECVCVWRRMRVHRPRRATPLSSMVVVVSSLWRLGSQVKGGGGCEGQRLPSPKGLQSPQWIDCLHIRKASSLR